MADPRDTLLSSEDQQIAAEIMAAVDVRKLGGGDDAVDRTHAPQRDDIDPGTLLATVHSGSHTPGDEIAGSPLPADFLAAAYDSIETAFGQDDADEEPGNTVRGPTSDATPGEEPPDGGGDPRGGRAPRSAATDSNDAARSADATDEVPDDTDGADAGAPGRRGDGETFDDDTAAETTGTAGPGNLESDGPSGPQPQFRSEPFYLDDGDEDAIYPPDEQDGGVTQWSQPNLADAPVLTTSDASGDEDSAIDLDIAAALTDASESLSVTISGVPAGATLSAGIDDGDGTWTLTGADLTGLRITPPADSDADFSLTVTAVSTSDVDSASTVQILEVNVNAVADAPQAVGGDVSGNEDSAIALDVTATLTDSSETLSVTISGVPATATLSAGTDNGDGTWTLTQGQLSGLTITPPANSDADFSLTVTATSTDGDDTADTSWTIDVTVDAVADAPTLTVSDASGNEDGAIALDISAALTDSSETLSVTISGVPAGATLSAGTDNGDGTWTLTQGQLLGLTITPPAGSDADFTLTVTATATDGSDTAQTAGTVDVTVDAVADAPTVTANGVSGDQDGAIALDVTSVLTDTDGSETLSVTVSGVPTGASLSAGTDDGDGTWTLDPGDLAGLAVTPPAGSSDDFSLTVTATSTESENGDTAQSMATFDVTVTADTVQAVDGDQNANKNDQLYGGDGEDLIHGYTKNDQLWGGDGDDTLYGDGGNDVLRGEAGYDTLIGGTGNDQLFGGAGNDTLSMGAGNDVASGEDGSDMLFFAEGDGANNVFHGGDGGAWTDTIQLQDAQGGAPGEGWVLDLTSGEQVSSGSGYLDLSQDSAGSITLEDGSVLTFDGVEKLTW